MRKVSTLTGLYGRSSSIVDSSDVIHREYFSAEFASFNPSIWGCAIGIFVFDMTHLPKMARKCREHGGKRVYQCNIGAPVIHIAGSYHEAQLCVLSVGICTVNANAFHFVQTDALDGAHVNHPFELSSAVVWLGVDEQLGASNTTMDCK
ncbi:hypothetical protein JG687_00016283 [Phytophthora cactorum]|uniref:Uncharacterized protein n=2 Tax=Phytophthora TaxID=4783 RepID=A0A8T1TR37_9STRA|nr:hypothetical protein JG687_00016283 [Phytophthora cactorum]